MWISAAAEHHHQIGRAVVADITAAAFRLDQHVVPGRLAKGINRIMRHKNKKGTFSLIVKTRYGIFPPM
ncbi:hypothetical protein ACWTU6_18415 [Mesorhizobium sp. BHbsci]